MTTGERIKARRKQLSISADELAERVGVSRSTVFRWENGDVEKIPATDLNNVAIVLQTTAEYLFGFVDDPDMDLAAARASDNRKTITIQNDDVRILASGMDRMPKADREKALAFVKLMFDKYADYFERKDDDNDHDGA